MESSRRSRARAHRGAVSLTPFVADPDFTLYQGDALDVLRELADEAVHCVVTSPPYWGLRDYGADGQLGLEPTPEEYVANMVELFREVSRVLRRDGTCWLNLGDSYAANGTGPGRENEYPQTLAPAAGARRIDHRSAGLKPKDLCGIPWRVAFALQADGWYLRSDIIWAKTNPMPESVTDRPTKAHEYLFLLTRSPRYFYDADAIREAYKYDGRTVTAVKGGDGSIQHRNGERWPGLKPRSSGNLERKPNPAAVLGQGDTKHGIPWTEDGTGRNARSVWEIATQAYPEAHFATFPEELARRCIAAGTSERGCCPECGAPWERETVTERVNGGPKWAPNAGNRAALGDVSPSSVFRTGLQPQTTTIGFRPTCDCVVSIEDALLPAPIPCVVLDPFMGSGTVAHVARKLGRRSIGVELNPDYCALAAQRLRQLSLLAEEGAA